MSIVFDLLNSDEECGSEEHRAWLHQVQIEAVRFYRAKAQKMASHLLHRSDLPTSQEGNHQDSAVSVESELSKPALGLGI